MQTHSQMRYRGDPLLSFRRAVLQGLFKPGMRDYYESPKPQFAYVKPNTFTFLRHAVYHPIRLDEPISASVKFEWCETPYPIDEMKMFPLLHHWPCKCGAVIWALR